MRRPSAIARAEARRAAKRRHAAFRLQRIARRNQQPDLVQPQPPPRNPGDMQMAFMGGIERSAEQADAGAPAVTEGGYQGRTWPLPVTR